MIAAVLVARRQQRARSQLLSPTMQAHTIPLVSTRCRLESARCAGYLEAIEPERLLRRARRLT